MAKRKVTITDVARAAGVSISTVSRVMNNSKPVNQELRELVEKSMYDLGYQPNILAQNLRSHSVAAIGVIIPDIRAPFFSMVVRGIEDVCFANDHTVFLCNSDDDPEKELIYAEELFRRQVDGIIFASAWGWEFSEPLEDLNRRGMPMALINRTVLDLAVDMVLVDKNTGNYTATKHLLELGHRVIGCITMRSGGGAGEEEVLGYRQALTRWRIAVDESLIVPATPLAAEGRLAARKLLSRKPRPTAIFARSDTLALGVLYAAWEMGIKVPDELSVIGYSDAINMEYLTPPLTTIRQPQYEMGSSAATALFERIARPDLPQRRTVIQPQLMVRGTTGPAPDTEHSELAIQSAEPA